MSQFKKKLAAFTAMLAFLSLSGAASAGEFLGGNAVSQGNTSNVDLINASANQMNVNINSGADGAVGQVDWGRFNVGNGQTVFFGFSGLSQTIINRVLGGAKSEIYGNLLSGCANGGNCSSYGTTGKVVLINPAGILFGENSKVDINSFTASTYDFKGAKNLNNLGGMTEQEYLSSLRQGTQGSDPATSYQFNNNLNFDSTYTQAFTDAGIDVSALQNGTTKISLNGAEFNHFADGLNTNKTVNIVADNIDYKNSIISTGDNANYIGGSSYGNVNLVTADGVNFAYLANGYAKSYNATNNNNTGIVRTITMDNSGLEPTQEAIRSGDVKIHNLSDTEGSDINISNTIIKGTKLVNKENGDIYIRGQKNVNINHSRLTTINKETDGNNLTANQNGGEIFIGGGNTTIKDSLLYSSGANKDAENASAAGNIRINANNGTVKISNSKILSKGDTKVAASDKVDIDGSLIQAHNTVDESLVKNVSIKGTNEVKIHNTTIDSQGDIAISALDGDKNTVGSIKISADEPAKGIILAGDKLSIQGATTNLNNATLTYDVLKFYNDGSNGINNVTAENGTTFSQINPETGNVGDVTTLETNGDFVLKNTKGQRAIISLRYDKNPDETLVDDGTIDAISYSTSVKATADTGDLNVTSTEGNVVVEGNSDIHTGRNINLTSNAKDVKIAKSSLTAGKDLNVNAQKGSIYITDNSTTTATNDVNLKSKNSITFGTKGDSNVNIDNSSNISAGHDINVTSLASDINAEKTTMPTLTYGNRLKFDAKGNNNFTSNDSLKSVNVDYVAGGANNITTTGDMQFVNSTLKAPNNNIKATGEGGDIILNNLEIKVATADAKDTVTNIEAKGDVTTVDVTGSYAADSSATSHTYPNSVSANRTGNTDTTLDVNGTKLKVHATAKQTTADPDLGSITLKVADTSTAAGIELTAENYDNGSYKYDENPGYTDNGTSYGPVVTLKQGDNNPVAVSKIVTDKLVLGNTKIKAASVNPNDLPAGTLDKFPEANQQSPKGVIVVRDYMGFDQDNDFTKNDPDAFDYDSHFDPKDLPGDKDGFGKHLISYDNPDEQFMLVYDRPVNEQPQQVIVQPEEPVVLNPDSLIQIVKLPREQVEISKTSKVSDNTVDQTGNIMSAAAKVELADEANASSDDDDEEEYTE